MGILSTFDVASARFLGLDHEDKRRNCQDYVLLRDDANGSVCAVSDGVGSGDHNEVGAALGLEILATHVAQSIGARGVAGLDWGVLLDLYADDVEHIIRDMMGGINDELFLAIASQFFSHTVVMCVMDDERAQLVRFGDGYVGLNGYIVSKTIPYKDDKPPFPIYYLYQRLKLRRFRDFDWDAQYPAGLRFEVVADMPVADIDTFLLGTDGLRYVERNANERLPGRKHAVGPVEQFMMQANYVDPQALENRLHVIGMPHPLLEPGDTRPQDPGYLRDDVALIVGRRKESDASHDTHGG